jgi:hypothetical protein
LYWRDRVALKIRFGKHAKVAMASRKINTKIILLTLKKPEERFYDISTGHRVSIRRINGNSLVVVYDVFEKTHEIVTVFATSRIEKIIKRKVEIGYWMGL